MNTGFLLVRLLGIRWLVLMSRDTKLRWPGSVSTLSGLPSPLSRLRSNITSPTKDDGLFLALAAGDTALLCNCGASSRAFSTTRMHAFTSNTSIFLSQGVFLRPAALPAVAPITDQELKAERIDPKTWLKTYA